MDLITIGVICIVAFLIYQFIFPLLPSPIRPVAIAVLALVICVWLLQSFGIATRIPWGR